MDLKEKTMQTSQEAKVPYKIIVMMIVLRLIIIPLLNYDYPDEYWQGPQIAYKMYNRLINNKQLGYQTWQWTMNDPIRNPVYQFLLSLGYMGAHLICYVVEYVHENYGYNFGYYLLSADMIMEYSPKIVQLILAILGDVYVIKLAYFYFPKPNISTFSIFFVLFNWFYLSMLSRTYINSFECVLMSIAFYYWQLNHYQNSYKIHNGNPIQLLLWEDLTSRIVVLIAYVARPTSLIPWMIIWPHEVFSYVYECFIVNNTGTNTDVSKMNTIKRFFKSLDKTIICKMIAKNLTQILLMFLSSFLMGSLYFQKPILTQWNFLYYNLVLNWSSLFGSHPLYFYFGVTMPIVFGLYLLFVVMGLFVGIAKAKLIQHKGQQTLKCRQYGNLCWISVVFLVLTTLVSGHKQHRFVMISMPLLLMILFAGYIKLRQALWNSVNKKLLKRLCFIAVIITIVISNIWMLGSVAFYPKGGFDILRKIRTQIDSKQRMQLIGNQHKSEHNKPTVMYLGDAHTLPGYSLILRNIELVIPDESPLAKLQNRSQTELLRVNPQKAYNRMVEKLSKKISNNTRGVKIDFIILQHKYCKHHWVVDSQEDKSKRLDKIRNGIIFPREQYRVQQRCRFILRDYERVMVSSNRNLWEHNIFGPDFLILYVNNKLS